MNLIDRFTRSAARHAEQIEAARDRVAAVETHRQGLLDRVADGEDVPAKALEAADKDMDAAQRELVRQMDIQARIDARKAAEEAAEQALQAAARRKQAEALAARRLELAKEIDAAVAHLGALTADFEATGPQLSEIGAAEFRADGTPRVRLDRHPASPATVRNAIAIALRDRGGLKWLVPGHPFGAVAPLVADAVRHEDESFLNSQKGEHHE